MTRTERNKDYEDNFEYYVLELMKFPDNKLEKKLDLVRVQMELATKINDPEVYQTLYWWEMHIIEARIRKTELADEPYFDEIETAIANMETINVRSEERQETMEETLSINTARKSKIKEDNSSQMNLF